MGSVRYWYDEKRGVHRAKITLPGGRTRTVESVSKAMLKVKVQTIQRKDAERSANLKF